MVADQPSLMDVEASAALDRHLARDDRAWLYGVWLQHQMGAGTLNEQERQQSIDMLRKIYDSAWQEFLQSWAEAQQREWRKGFNFLHDQRGPGRVVGVKEITESEKYLLDPFSWLYVTLVSMGAVPDPQAL